MVCWIIYIGEFHGTKTSPYVESLFMNGHGELPSKMNCDCFIKIELMYFIDRLWIYCDA